jgi:hypothetical protein
MRDNAVERLFSFFTSSDRAVAIAGDLAEERDQRGWIWFSLHVVSVTSHSGVAPRRKHRCECSRSCWQDWRSYPRQHSEESPRSFWFPS